MHSPPLSSAVPTAAVAAAAILPPFLRFRHRSFSPTRYPFQIPPPSPHVLRCAAHSDADRPPLIIQRDGSEEAKGDPDHHRLRIAVGSSPSFFGTSRPEDRAFLICSFAAFTTSLAFAGLVVAAVPTLLAMRKTALSLAKLADTASEELPSTMAAIRLSGMEISDLTIELSDLSQEIADGVNKSVQAVQAAKAGVRLIGALAREKTMLIIEERANLPEITLKPVVTGAAKKTSDVVGQAKKKLMNIISGGDSNSE